MLAAIKRFFGFDEEESSATKEETAPPKPHPALKQELLTRPWRKSSPLDSERLLYLKEKLRNYHVQLDGKSFQTKILLLGNIGHGKSSYINTIDSIFQERFTQKCPAGSATYNMTVTFRELKIRSGESENNLNFRLCDTCGIGGVHGPNLADLVYILHGNIPDGYVVWIETQRLQ